MQRVDVITLDDNHAAIIEVKTGPTAQLTINQEIDYQQAIDSCGAELCGINSIRFNEARESNDAPTVVYVLRNIEL